jgi:hypothetical protein
VRAREYVSAVPGPPPHALGLVIVKVLAGRIQHYSASPPRRTLGAYEGFLHIKKKLFMNIFGILTFGRMYVLL